MKAITSFLMLLLFFSCARGKQISYTGSTPADNIVRSFLGIPLQDSIDFIRWQLAMDENNYKLHCNYGIGKANTNGFIEGGKTVDISGTWNKKQNELQLHSGDKILKLAEFNPDLLHLMGANNELLVGNGGWSYTLNSTMPINSDEMNILGLHTPIEDSLDFEGRTPCNIPGVIPAGENCYKLKWRIVLYADAAKKDAGTFIIKGTAWRRAGAAKGSWQLIKGKDGRIIYKLSDDQGNAFVYLLKADENILVFTDEQGKLLVGTEDFSYTMNSVDKS